MYCHGFKFPVFLLVSWNIFHTWINWDSISNIHTFGYHDVLHNCNVNVNKLKNTYWTFLSVYMYCSPRKQAVWMDFDMLLGRLTSISPSTAWFLGLRILMKIDPSKFKSDLWWHFQKVSYLLMRTGMRNTHTIGHNDVRISTCNCYFNNFLVNKRRLVLNIT